MAYQPGDYELSNKYFNQDTQDNNRRSRTNSNNANANEAYKSLFEDNDNNWDSEINSSNNHNNVNTKVGSSKESIKSVKTQASYKSQKKIAAEAGFSIREPSETYIQIESASPKSPTGHNLKENSRSHLKVNIDVPDGWKRTSNLGTLKKTTLSRPERKITTRRKTFMRSENDLPPVVRTGNIFLLK